VTPERRAAQLLDSWTRLCQGHLAIGSGCSCGAGVSVRVGDFELDLLRYLQGKFGSSAAVLAAGSIAELLAALERPQTADRPDARALLDSLAASIASFEQAHGG